MKALVIIFGIFLILFGIASYAYNTITFSNYEQLVTLGEFFQRINVFSISPTISSIIMAVGVVIVIVGFASK